MLRLFSGLKRKFHSLGYVFNVNQTKVGFSFLLDLLSLMKHSAGSLIEASIYSDKQVRWPISNEGSTKTQLFESFNTEYSVSLDKGCFILFRH
mgnify:CR=1 FL=1